MKYKENIHRCVVRGMISFVFEVNKYLGKSGIRNHKEHVYKIRIGYF